MDLWKKSTSNSHGFVSNSDITRCFVHMEDRNQWQEAEAVFRELPGGGQGYWSLAIIGKTKTSKGSEPELFWMDGSSYCILYIILAKICRYSFVSIFELIPSNICLVFLAQACPFWVTMLWKTGRQNLAVYEKPWTISKSHQTMYSFWIIQLCLLTFINSQASCCRGALHGCTGCRSLPTWRPDLGGGLWFGLICPSHWSTAGPWTCDHRSQRDGHGQGRLLGWRSQGSNHGLGWLLARIGGVSGRRWDRSSPLCLAIFVQLTNCHFYLKKKQNTNGVWQVALMASSLMPIPCLLEKLLAMERSVPFSLKLPDYCAQASNASVSHCWLVKQGLFLGCICCLIFQAAVSASTTMPAAPGWSACKASAPRPCPNSWLQAFWRSRSCSCDEKNWYFSLTMRFLAVRRIRSSVARDPAAATSGRIVSWFQWPSDSRREALEPKSQVIWEASKEMIWQMGFSENGCGWQSKKAAGRHHFPSVEDEPKEFAELVWGTHLDVLLDQQHGTLS